MCNANLQSACTCINIVHCGFLIGFFNFSFFFQEPHTAVKSKCDPPPHSSQL